MSIPKGLGGLIRRVSGEEWRGWAPLLGAHIEKVQASAQGVALLVRRDDITKWLKATAIGDCCSHAWIEHISGLDALTGGPVSDVPGLIDSFEVPPEDCRCSEIGSASRINGREDDYGEAEDRYVYTIATPAGRCDIELRCSHNGYYSGWLELDWLDEDPRIIEPKTREAREALGLS